jgi:hypothetical protein
MSDVAPPTRDELLHALAGAQEETARRAIDTAERMREEAGRIMALATQLEGRANRLLAGAEALGLELSDDERPESVDEDFSVNSRGEKITFEVARDTAKELGRFDRSHFQDALAVKPVVASRWLARLRDVGMLDRIDSDGGPTVYDYVKPEDPGGPPPARRERPEDRERRMANGRGKTVAGTGRDAKHNKKTKEKHSIPGRRHPGRKN